MKRKFSLLMVMSSMALGLMMGSCSDNRTDTPNNPDTPVNPDKPVDPTPDPDPEPTPDPEPEALPEKYDLMKYWSGHMEETVYDVVENKDSTVINYTDVKGENLGGWEFVGRSFAFDAKDIARFGEYKTLTFTGNMTTTSGSNVVMVKIEGTDGNSIEKKFNFLPEEKTYELALTTLTDWTKVQKLLFFANRSTSESGSGTMTFKEIALSKAEVNPANDIAADMPKVPQDVNLYNGGDKLTVMQSWGYDDKGCFKTEAVEGGYKFTYGEGSKEKEEWAYVKARVKGGEKDLATSGLKRVHFKLKGTKGNNALIKFECLGAPGAKEFMINSLTGDVEEYDLDISELIKTTHEDGHEPEFIAAIFPAAGRKGADLAGEITLLDCFLDKTEAVDPTTIYNNNRVGDEIKVTKLQNQEPVYTITSTDNNHKIAYELANVPDYRGIRITTKGEKLEELNELTFTATSTVDVEIIVKPYDFADNKVELKANEAKEVKISFDGTKVDLNKQTILMIGTSATSAKKGVIDFKNVTFKKGVVVPEIPTNKVEDNRRIRINNFHSYNKDIYTVTNNGNTTKIDFAKTAANDWDSIKFSTKGENLKDYTLLTGTVTTTVKCSFIVKAYDGNEVKVEPLEPNTPYQINKVLENADFTKDGLIFVAFGGEDTKTGSIEFKDLQLRRNLPYNEVKDNEIAITKFHSYKENLYTITTEGNKTTIDFNKTPAEDWENIQFTTDGANLKYYNHLTGTLKTSVKASVIVKAYDGNEVKVEPLEANTPYQIDKVLENADYTKNGFIFVAFGGEDTKVGTLEITDLKLTHYTPTNKVEGNVININQFTDYREDLYKITTEGNKTTIAFTKTAAEDWENIQFVIEGENLDQFTKLTGTVTTSVKCSFIVKPYDSNEVKVEPLEANTPYEINKTLTGFDTTKRGYIFVAFSAGDTKTGTITFENLQLAK